MVTAALSKALLARGCSGRLVPQWTARLEIRILIDTQTPRPVALCPEHNEMELRCAAHGPAVQHEHCRDNSRVHSLCMFTNKRTADAEEKFMNTVSRRQGCVTRTIYYGFGLSLSVRRTHRKEQPIRVRDRGQLGLLRSPYLFFRDKRHDTASMNTLFKVFVGSLLFWTVQGDSQSDVECPLYQRTTEKVIQPSTVVISMA